jgi:hypothetical protein
MKTKIKMAYQLEAKTCHIIYQLLKLFIYVLWFEGSVTGQNGWNSKMQNDIVYLNLVLDFTNFVRFIYVYILIYTYSVKLIYELTQSRLFSESVRREIGFACQDFSKSRTLHFIIPVQLFDRLCGLVVRVPGYRSALPDFLRSSGSGTGSTQPRDYN